MVSWTHYLLVNLKHKNGNLKNEKRIKNKWPKYLLKSPRSLKQKSVIWWRQSDPLSGPVAGNVFI